jgi:hypothetical protein
METGQPDSAVAWFPRASIKDMRIIGRAVTMYQSAGLLTRADSLINLMGSSVARDTLMIRQMIFKGKPDEARSLAAGNTIKKHWAGVRSERWLWMTRVNVFNGELAAAAACIDSAGFDADWHAAREMLEHRYASAVFMSAPELFGAWGKMMLAAYQGHPETIADTIASLNPEKSVREYMLAALARALLDAGMYDRCTQVISGKSGTEPSYRLILLCAEACIMQGKNEEAVRMLENIVLECPDDIFSDKARMYLLGLDGKTKK